MSCPKAACQCKGRMRATRASAKEASAIRINLAVETTNFSTGRWKRALSKRFGKRLLLRDGRRSTVAMRRKHAGLARIETLNAISKLSPDRFTSSPLAATNARSAQTLLTALVRWRSVQCVRGC
jgi:hypothetical protein